MLYSYVKTDNSEDVHQMFTIVLLEGKKEEKRKKKKEREKTKPVRTLTCGS